MSGEGGKEGGWGRRKGWWCGTERMESTGLCIHLLEHVYVFDVLHSIFSCGIKFTSNHSP